MKRILFISSALAMGCMLFGGLSLSSLGSTQAKADGPTSSSIPSKMNINLNDKTEDEVRSYYSALNGKNLSGNNLLKALRPILQDFTYYSYDDCWKMYEITDREWALSPADEITQGSYSDTGIITNYTFGKGVSQPGADNPYVRALYRNRDSNGVTVESGRIRAWESHTQTGGFNREHVWCQSRGFKAPSGANGPAGTDVHHLMAGDGFVNGQDNQHNNNPYGFVDTSKTYYDGATMNNGYAYCAGNLGGKQVNSSSSDVASKVFEPQDSDKGDIARACFYMVACYNNLSGTETITQYNPNLTLCDYATSNSASEISSEVGHAVGMGILRDLLVWHRLDPVDDYEIHRNNLIDRNFQHNRNPFIDYPDWVEAIWGQATLNKTTKKVTYDPTPVGYADPEHDDVRTYGESWATVQSIAVSGQKTEFTVGDSFSFGGTVTATLSDSTQQNVTSNCTFSGYNMSTAGNQTVTVTHTPSGKITTYSITVSVPRTPQSIVVTGQKTAFEVGDDFSFDGTVTLTYSDSSQETVTSGCTFSGYDMNTPGNQTVTVTHTASGLTTTYGITVSGSTPQPTVSETGYTLVTSADELRDGDKILVVGDENDSNKSLFALSTTQNTNNRGAAAVSATDNVISSPSNSVCIITLGKADDTKWTLYASSKAGYLYAASSTANHLKTQAYLDDNAKWTIAIDSDDGRATITAQGSNTRNILQYNRANDLFACYSSDQTKPYIYKCYGAEADNYGKAFIDTYTAGCNENGIGSDIKWSGASAAFSGLTDGAKSILSSISSTAGTAYRHQCVARYDYIVGKYGTGPYPNFMSRPVKTNNGSLHAGFPTAFDWQNILLIALGISGLGSIFFFVSKKKKRA